MNHGHTISITSFSGTLLESKDVVKVIHKPRLVTTIPAWLGTLVHLGDSIPGLALGLLRSIVNDH